MNNSVPEVPESAFPDLKLAEVAVSRGAYLPMWEAQGAIYHISLHLADSVPQSEIRIWKEERARIASRLNDAVNPPLATERECLVEEMRAVYNERVEKYLNAGCGACVLRDPRAAKAVAETLEHDNGRLYALHAYAVMPNHLHVIAGGFGESGRLRDVIETWKRVAAHRIAKFHDVDGPLWRRDMYTHVIRNAVEYKAQLAYVWANPDVAGLRDGFLRKCFVRARG